MSQYLFQENQKKSRRKALMLTILFHILIIGGLVYNSVGETSEIKSMIQDWMDTSPDEELVSMI